MLKELKKIVNEFLGDSPFLVSQKIAMLQGGVRLIFPLSPGQVEEFARTLAGAQTPGWSWETHLVPMVFVDDRAGFQGIWAAVEVRRKPLGAPAAA